MFKHILKTLAPWIIIVGLVIWAFGIYQSGMSVVEQRSINYGTFTWYYYRINVSQYLQNLQESFDINQLRNIRIEVPELPMYQKINNAADVAKAFLNGITFLINGVIMILNAAIVAPTKIIFYPFNIIFSLLGLNTATEGWIGAFKLIYEWNIPYIPPLI